MGKRGEWRVVVYREYPQYTHFGQVIESVTRGWEPNRVRYRKKSEAAHHARYLTKKGNKSIAVHQKALVSTLALLNG